MTSCAFTRGESNSGRESDFGTTPVSRASYQERACETETVLQHM